MLRLSRQTDYGIVLLTHIANRPEGPACSARELARKTRVPLPMVSKILKLLVNDGILISHRGVKGGYSLARRPEAISVAEIVTAMEGPIAVTLCISAPGDCRQESICLVRTNWHKINQTVQKALEGISLSEMSHPFSDHFVPLTGIGAQAVTLS